MTIDRADDIAASFIGWQCRLRQHSVRRGDGRPSAGMRARVTLADGRDLGSIVTVLVKAEPDAAIAQFRYIVKQTFDPQLRYEAAIKTLQTVYYQYPREFSNEFTALFSRNASVAAAILSSSGATLEFSQANQRYTLPCTAVALAAGDPFYEATYWHNAMFNPRLSGPVDVLKFRPDWAQAVAQTA